MPSNNKEFALYCCDLLAGVGPCVAKRMFGGWGISIDGMTLALMTDLGGGDKLWLKANEDTRGQFEAAGCERFTYLMGGVSKSMGYYAAPEDAMESAPLMLPWARLALDAALKARALADAKPKHKPKLRAKAKAVAKPASKT